MRADILRETFEAEFPPPIIIRFNRQKSVYEPDGEPYDEAEECAFNHTLQWQAWLAAHRRDEGAVAWVQVPKGEQKSSHYPGYTFHGVRNLPPGNHYLYVAPRPTVPESDWRPCKGSWDESDTNVKQYLDRGGSDPVAITQIVWNALKPTGPEVPDA